MKGYVKNIGKAPQYIMKRHVAPLDIIPIEDIEKRYLEVSGAKNAASFTKWLRKYVFEGTSIWDVSITDKEAPSKPDKPKPVKKKSGKITAGTGGIQTKVTPAQLVKVSYKKCAELAAKCSDPRVIKEALQKANTMARKEKTCQILRDRLAELG